MSLLLILSLLIAAFQYGQQYEMYPTDTTLRGGLSCPNDHKCAFIDYCPSTLALMNRNDFPVSRFRQAICGYDDGRPKVCCHRSTYWMPTQFVRADQAAPWENKSNIHCGKSLIPSVPQTVGSYPFLARIGFIDALTGSIKYPCTGVIINDRSVLTTASCALATSARYKLHTVLIGEFNIETDPDCNSLFCGHMSKCYNISYVIKHPGYQADTFANNIAILRLKKHIAFSATAQPVCFLPEDRYLPVGSKAVLVGWGEISDQTVKSPLQQCLEMDILTKEQCSSFINQGISVELCAAGRREPCSGYSGSPLLFKYGETHFLVGILSCGSDCDIHLHLPSVFVNVQKYIRWLQENS